MLDEFQSTHPARGATDILALDQVKTSISIHAPREGCDTRTAKQILYLWWYFNPRTPRGVRLISAGGLRRQKAFQSTHPARGATGDFFNVFAAVFVISIHAPREGCDGFLGCSAPCRFYFNPRTPRGVRPSSGIFCCVFCNISIHAPREGCDSQLCARAFAIAHFNPRTPRGVRRAQLASCCCDTRISIHAPREGCDSKLYQRAGSLLGSICLFAQGEEG